MHARNGEARTGWGMGSGADDERTSPPLDMYLCTRPREMATRRCRARMQAYTARLIARSKPRARHIGEIGSSAWLAWREGRYLLVLAA
jgi:hypothetical protein